jgi:hypothetical protein
MPALAQDCVERVSSVEKGSLLIYPKVEIVWNRQGQILQDTFIDLTNDYPEDVLVQMQFVNGDPPWGALPFQGQCVENVCIPFDPGIDHPSNFCYCDAFVPCNERAHLGWVSVDVMIELTANEPTYWAASSGLPKGTSPFSILDPGTPNGRPDGFDPFKGVACERRLRGYILAWAVDNNGEQIGWNHLKGDALVVDYQRQAAWEYNAYAFQVHSVERGELVLAEGADPAMLELNGDVYDSPFDQLLLDFYAYDPDRTPAEPGPFDQANGPGGAYWFAEVRTDLTLLPLDIDLTQESPGPTTTKANFDIWNMNEWKFSGTHRCVTCWDQEWLDWYDAPNHFLRDNLQTNKGKARIDGIASLVCPGTPDRETGAARPSVETPLLGLAMKQIRFAKAPVFAKAGMNLVGMGTQDATIYADVTTQPPDEKAAERFIRGFGKGSFDLGR